MIKILIIDDDAKKLDKINKIIHDYDEISDKDIKICKCIIDAKRSLREFQYDLVILDIQLPMHDGEDPIHTGGIDLLREIHERTIYLKPLCIIGLTAYQDTVEEANPLFEDRMWNIVFYNPLNSIWSERLTRKIEYILEYSRARGQRKDNYKYDLAIITALPTPEFDSVLELTDWENVCVDTDCTRYIEGEFRAGEKKLQVIAACAPQMGMPATAVTATKLIYHFQPEYLCMIGITAGVPGAVSLGDVVVADPSWDWGSGKLKTRSSSVYLHPDPLPERLDPKVRAMLRDAALDKDMILSIWSSYKRGKKPSIPPSLYVGPCASGACVVADGQVVESIKEHSRKLIGIEMEAYGLMHAATHGIGNRPLAFSMKSVCDFADMSKNDDIQEFSAYMSAELLKKIALKYF